MRSSLSGCYHIDADDLVYIHCISNQGTKQSFKFQRDPSFNCFTIVEFIILFPYFTLLLFLYLILHKCCTVLTCDMLGIGFVIGTIFI